MKKCLKDRVHDFIAYFGANTYEFVLYFFKDLQIFDVECNLIAIIFKDDLLYYLHRYLIFFNFYYL